MSWSVIALALAAAHNLVVALVYGWDKWAAQKGRRRISERRLLMLAALFGGPGAFFGMRAFRHKTQKPRFRFGIPALLALQALLVGYLLWRAI